MLWDAELCKTAFYYSSILEHVESCLNNQYVQDVSSLLEGMREVSVGGHVDFGVVQTTPFANLPDNSTSTSLQEVADLLKGRQGNDALGPLFLSGG